MEDDVINKLVSLQDDEIASASNKELKKLMNQLMEKVAEAKIKLQDTEEERKLAEKETELCILERDKLLPLVRLASEKVSALRALDAEKQRSLMLSRQLEEEEALRSCPQESSENTLKGLQEKEAVLSKEEESLRLQCAAIRQSLAQVQSSCLAAEEDLQRLQGHVTGQSGRLPRGKQEVLLDEHVSALNVPTVLGQAGIKRRGKRQ